MNAQRPKKAEGLAPTVFGVPGGFYEGEVPDTSCFVPLALIGAGQLDRAKYIAQQWASLNVKAQPLDRRLGSHLFPDLKKPVTETARCEQMRCALDRLRPIPAAATT